MKKIFLLLLLCSAGFAQDLSYYKYVLVPSKFSFQAAKGQYNLNNLARMILEKNDFEVYFDDEIFPDAFAGDNCNKLYADFEVINTILTTKLKIVLKDCKNNIVFKSDQGKSADKNQSVAYLNALQMAAQSLSALKHKYKQVLPTTPSSDKQIGRIIDSSATEKEVLVAEPIENGWNLVDSEKKVQFVIVKTSLQDFFLATNNNQHGIIYLKNECWFFEFYDKQLQRQQLYIKFVRK